MLKIDDYNNIIEVFQSFNFNLFSFYFLPRDFRSFISKFPKKFSSSTLHLWCTI